MKIYQTFYWRTQFSHSLQKTIKKREKFLWAHKNRKNVELFFLLF